MHPHAREAAQAAEAAALQGRFLDMARTMFANQDRLDDRRPLPATRASSASTWTASSTDLRSPAVVRRVEDDMLDAELMDLHSTPTFFIGERRHKGPYDSATLIAALEAGRGLDEEEARAARAEAKARAAREPGDA